MPKTCGRHAEDTISRMKFSGGAGGGGAASGAAGAAGAERAAGSGGAAGEAEQDQITSGPNSFRK